ncbi:hypothetical protein GGR13_000312 [Brevundimonas variabilis]|uniref:BLUF domain-containing protein n=1 Tax=Brevundimonas variabilis TaxID=74312 RepID=A0A7W9CFK7_9CAUL|nr:hypothetical protein [Brevundimonas variabilis]
MLVRVAYVSNLIGTAGRSPLSMAQIVGVSDVNNRRDHLCTSMLFHDGQVVQVIEGQRVDVDRLLRRLDSDARLGPLRMVCDMPIRERALTEAVTVCHEPQRTLDHVGLTDLDHVTHGSLEAMLEYRIAA